MDQEGIRRESTGADSLHPIVYVVAIGAALWLLTATWVIFAGSGYMELILAVVTGFLVMAVGIPCVLWRISRNDPRTPHDPANGRAQSFRSWAHGEFHGGQGEMSGRDAAIEMLVPLLAGGVAMTLFGIGVYFALGHMA